MSRRLTLTRRVSAAWKAGGMAGLVRAALARVADVRAMLLLAAPTASGHDPATEVPFEWASREVFERELATPEWQFPSAVAARARQWLARGDRCLVGRVEGRPATTLWVGTTIRELPGARCPIGRGRAYVYKTFTLPAFRGQGLNTAALRDVRRRCAEEGCDEVLIDVARSNTASRRAIERAGFAPVGRFLIVRIGRVRLSVMSPSVRHRIAGARRA